MSTFELWKILTDETSKPKNDENHVIWENLQKRLKDMLSLTLEETSKSLMIRNEEKNVTQLYKILKDEYYSLENDWARKKFESDESIKKRDKSADRDKDQN